MTEITKDMERQKKKAKPSGDSSHIYLPKDWEGDEILAINLDSEHRRSGWMTEKIEKKDIDVLGTQWKERNKDSGRHEVLQIEHKGNEVEIPVTKIDSTDFGDIWDADWVYLYMDIIAVEKYDGETGDIHMIEYEENEEGILKYERGYTLNEDRPGKTAISSKVIWSRE